MFFDKSNIINCKNSNPKDVVSISVPLYESIDGHYFVGQTCPLMVKDGTYAWAGLVNPRKSYSELYVNVFTISNFSDNYLTAEIWLNVDFPNKACVSHKVSPTNTAINPLPENNVEIKYIDSTNKLPEEGINVYERIVPPYATLVSEEDGKFIVPPCGNYTLIIKSSSSNLDKVIVAFGWWEK
ncbi:MAG: hypothetical protein K0Q97_2142 [Bacillota bacterium]|jgi:hypothetical protein|nr:hypothetical protein [Bacillota bacterium]